MGPPKHGIVSRLPSPFARRVRAIWRRLERDHGLRGVLVMPFPHFSYQVAADYDRDALESALARLAGTLPPFVVRTDGVATFPGPWPVVFIRVVADPHLRAVHRRIWSAVAPHVRDPMEYYLPGRWVPHITLAHGEERNSVPLSEPTVCSVLSALDLDGFRWSVPVRSLSLVWDEGSVQRPVRSFVLRGRS